MKGIFRRVEQEQAKLQAGGPEMAFLISAVRCDGSVQPGLRSCDGQQQSACGVRLSLAVASFPFQPLGQDLRRNPVPLNYEAQVLARYRKNFRRTADASNPSLSPRCF